jgi:hypothetical protein
VAASIAFAHDHLAWNVLSDPGARADRWAQKIDKLGFAASQKAIVGCPAPTGPSRHQHISSPTIFDVFGTGAFAPAGSSPPPGVTPLQRRSDANSRGNPQHFHVTCYANVARPPQCRGTDTPPARIIRRSTPVSILAAHRGRSRPAPKMARTRATSRRACTRGRSPERLLTRLTHLQRRAADAHRHSDNSPDANLCDFECHRIRRRRVSYISVNPISNIARRDTRNLAGATAPVANMRMGVTLSFEARSLLAGRTAPIPVAHLCR